MNSGSREASHIRPKAPGNARRSTPRTSLAPRTASCWTSRSISTAALKRCSRLFPDSVKRTWRVERSIKRMPSRFSIEASRFEIMLGCRCNKRPAATNVPCEAIARNAAISSLCCESKTSRFITGSIRQQNNERSMIAKLYVQQACSLALKCCTRCSNCSAVGPCTATKSPAPTVSVPANPDWAMRHDLMSQSYTARLDQLRLESSMSERYLGEALHP